MTRCNVEWLHNWEASLWLILAPLYTQRALEAVQGKQGAVDGDARPYCLILDEVDGALNSGDGKSGIAALVRMAQAHGGEGSGADHT